MGAGNSNFVTGSLPSTFQATSMYFLNVLCSNPAYQMSISKKHPRKTTQKKLRQNQPTTLAYPPNKQISHNSPAPQKYSNCAGAEKLPHKFAFNSMTHSSNFSPKILLHLLPHLLMKRLTLSDAFKHKTSLTPIYINIPPLRILSCKSRRESKPFTKYSQGFHFDSCYCSCLPSLSVI